MAKPRRRRDSDRGQSRRFDIYKQGRDDFSIASDLSSRVFEPAYRSLPNKINTVVDLDDNYISSVRSHFLDVEDRRTYHPAGRFRPAQSPRRHLAKTKIINPLTLHSRVISAFSFPRQIAICVRRHIRKEVMHALGRTGSGGSRNRRGRLSEYSKVRC